MWVEQAVRDMFPHRTLVLHLLDIPGGPFSTTSSGCFPTKMTLILHGFWSQETITAPLFVAIQKTCKGRK
jgi:hypothetical protein